MPTQSTRPKVTNDHLKKYDEIMKTSVPTPEGASPTPQPKGGILSSIPKPKGIGNKIFIFNGRKKIIMDGEEKEEEKAKTVDPKEMKKLEKEKEKEEAPPPPEIKPEQINKEKAEELKKEKKDEEEKEEKKEAKKSSKKTPPIVLILGLVVLFASWTTFWLFFFGFLSL